MDQTVTIVFGPRSVVPTVYIDGSSESPHRYSDAALCMWYPADPPESRWSRRDGSAALLGHIVAHLTREERWRQTGEWPGPEVQHLTADSTGEASRVVPPSSCPRSCLVSSWPRSLRPVSTSGSPAEAATVTSAAAPRRSGLICTRATRVLTVDAARCGGQVTSGGRWRGTVRGDRPMVAATNRVRDDELCSLISGPSITT